MNKFSFYITLMVVACAAVFSSCESDEEYPSITLLQKTVIFTELNESMDIYYTGSHVSALEANDVPEGWNVVINRGKKRITIYGPTTVKNFNSGSTHSEIIFKATSVDDNTSYGYLTVGTTIDKAKLDDYQANSYIVSQPNTLYTFDATTIGEGQGTITPSSIGILWQSSTTPISYARLNDEGKGEFYVAKDIEDFDGDEQFNDIIEGNAVIAAYNASGTILWSWHIWVSDYSAEASTVQLNGVTLMDRNLGAHANANTNVETIHSSYGLYYQWGRKDPFIRPYYYNAAGSMDGTMLNQTGGLVSIKYEESSSSVGTENYATKNPMSFILGVEKSSYDWIYKSHSSELWGETKTINDPCPKGWRVASSAAYADLKVPTLTSAELTSALDDYGWYMSDKSGASALLMGFGRRGYITGRIQNINLNESRPTPWAGYYWSADSAADGSDNSTALLFAIDAVDISGNKSMVNPYYRANGMQIRCQRNE